MDGCFELAWTIDQLDAGKKIKDFLAAEKISSRALTDIKFAGGKISVNGREENVRYTLMEGDRITVSFPAEPPGGEVSPSEMELDIIYEDRDVLVLNKPAGISTIPSREHPSGSVANGLAGYYQRNKIGSAIHIVTRLDRDTSGLMLIAKHRHAHHVLGLDQRTHAVNRRYEAFASGHPDSASLLIDAPIGRKEGSIIERKVREDGKRAVTHYEEIRRYCSFTHAGLVLETGRTHQIRVHLAFIGHPLLGDELYGGDRKLISRQALHCSSLSFRQPMTGEQLDFTVTLPQDMQNLLYEQEQT